MKIKTFEGEEKKNLKNKEKEVKEEIKNIVVRTENEIMFIKNGNKIK
ncbi:hypothetical protein [Clostridium autoethanogenum]|nr:hypothetical protein [Clostridium autoethanogenum]